VFDTRYRSALLTEQEDVEDNRLHVERESRAAIAERQTRTDSVADAKLDRTPSRGATASVDSFPDPRRFVPDGSPQACW